MGRVIDRLRGHKIRVKLPGVRKPIVGFLLDADEHLLQMAANEGYKGVKDSIFLAIAGAQITIIP